MKTKRTGRTKKNSDSKPRKRNVLRSVNFANFKRHEKRKLELSEGITTIVGATDAGKSSIVQGMAFVALNDVPKKPVKWGKTKGSVSFEIDGHTVKRTKGKSVNDYSIDGKKLKAFGKDVPDTVANLLNLVPENFQRQLDSHFWLTLSPGQLSKELNRIVDLEIVDKTLSHINNQIRKGKIENEVYQNQLKEAKAVKEELKWYPEFKAEAERLQELKNQYGEELRICDSAERTLETGRKCIRAIKTLSGAIFGAAKPIQLGNHARDLAKTIIEVQKFGKKFSKHSKKVGACPDITELKEIRNRGDQIARDRGDIEILLEELRIREKIDVETEKELNDLKLKLKRMKKVCPTCKRPLAKN